MIHFFTTPKAFVGHIGLIQENAIKSWVKLINPKHITLFGNEKGIKKIVNQYGLSHIPDIKMENGVPVLGDLFLKMHACGDQPHICYINADIMLFSDFKKALNLVSKRHTKYLMISSRYNLDVTTPLHLSENTTDILRREALTKHDMYPAAGTDFFCFPKDTLLTSVPPFLLGRGYWDNWLIWRARKEGAAIIDVTSDVVALHQNHDYRHVKNVGHSTNVQDVCREKEGQKNYKLSGGRHHIFCAYDADYVLKNNRMIRVWTSKLFYRKLKAHVRRAYLVLKRR